MTVTINGSGTMTGLAVGGLNDNIITKNEMATGGAWAPAGTVLQVVQGLSQTAYTTTSTTPSSTGLTASITPSSSTSKILCIFGARLYIVNIGNELRLALYRNGNQQFNGATLYNGGSNIAGLQGFTYLDSPSSTSSVTYTIYISSATNGQSVQFMPGSSGDGVGTLTLMEIAA